MDEPAAAPVGPSPAGSGSAGPGLAGPGPVGAAPAVGSPTRRRVVVATLAWVAVALGHFFSLWLFTWLFVGAWVVVGLLWLVAVAATVVLLVHLLGRRRWGAAAVAAVVATGVATAFVLTNWYVAFAYGWFALHPHGFAQVAALADADALGPAQEWGYYGRPLPWTLRPLSATGRIVHFGEVGGRDVLFLPEYVGFLDGAAGFARIPPGASPEWFDGFGDPVSPRFALGDDWYWVQ